MYPNPSHTSQHWICWFVHNIGITNSLAAELCGLKDGLNLAWKLNISKLIIEIDAKTVVAAILISDSTIATCSHPHTAWITDYRFLIQSFEKAHFLHVHYEGNFCVDLLAKVGNKTLEPFSKLVSPPSFIVSQLLADIWGISFSQTCNI